MDIPDGGSITFRVLPVAKPRMTARDRWKKRPCVLRYHAFKDEIKLILSQTGYKPGPRVRLLFFVPMPASWSAKKKAAMKRTPHMRRPDIDNYIKGVLDAVYADDSGVWQIEALKYWGEEPAIVFENIIGPPNA